MAEAPDIIISDEAAEYVRRRGGALTLRRTPRHGCCGGSVSVPIAEASTPPESSGYARYELGPPGGTITLFAQPDLGTSSTGPLRVGLDRLLGFASLYVEGADASM
jgi:hypothetical protein